MYNEHAVTVGEKPLLDQQSLYTRNSTPPRLISINHTALLLLHCILLGVQYTYEALHVQTAYMPGNSCRQEPPFSTRHTVGKVALTSPYVHLHLYCLKGGRGGGGLSLLGLAHT